MKTIVYKGHRLQRPVNSHKKLCSHNKLELQYIFYSPEIRKYSLFSTYIIASITNNNTAVQCLEKTMCVYNTLYDQKVIT